MTDATSTYTVTTFNDELDTDLGDLTDLSLREALVLASQNPGADTITFTSGGQITLDLNLAGPAPGRGNLYIAQDVTIDGDLDNDGTPDITIDGNNATRIFFVDSGAVTLEGLTLQHGIAVGLAGIGGAGGGLGAGGAIFVRNGAHLALDTVTFSGNQAHGGRGGNGGGGGNGPGPGVGLNGIDGGLGTTFQSGGGIFSQPGQGGAGGQFGAGGQGGIGGSGSGNGGGGGGGSAFAGGSGGAGGAGITVIINFGFGTTTQNRPGGNGGGGGGAALGGAIFLMDGAALTIAGGVSFETGAVSGGAGGNGGPAGSLNGHVSQPGTSGGSGAGLGTGLFLQNESVTFDLGAGKVVTVSDAIVGSGTAGLTKAGDGTLIIASADNDYSGTTSVQGGLLRVDGVIAHSAVTVANGGTLGGGGTVAAVTVDAGGTMAPGASAGTLTTGSVTLNGGANVVIEIGTSGHDQIKVVSAADTVALNNATLTLVALSGFNPASGTFVIIDNAGSDAITTTFAGLAEGAVVSAAAGNTYRISYAGGDGNDVVLTALNDAPVNTVPVGPLSVAEDIDLTIGGLSVSDAESISGEMTVTLTVAHGTLRIDDTVSGGLNSSEIAGNGTGILTLTGDLDAINTTLAAGVIYRGVSNYNGSDTLTMTSNNGESSSAEDIDIVAIDVTPVNDGPPSATDDALSSVAEDSGARDIAASTLLANDSAAPDANETLVIAGVSNPVGGSVILNGDGSVTFTPAGNFNGPASFDYVVNDGTPGNDDTGHVTFSVTPVDDGPPAASDDALSAVAEDSGARIIAAATLLANDSAAPDANETLVIAGVSNPVGGTVILNGDGSVTFTPAGNFNGAASFDYVVNDGTPGNDDTGHVTFSVTPVNDGTPTAADDALSSVAEDSGPRAIAAAALLTNDSSAPDSNETLVIAGVSNPVGGSVILNGDGSVTFTPAGNFNGPASFDYVVNDGTPGNDDTGHVTFSVTPVDDGPPAATDDALSSVPEDSGPRAIAAAALLTNDSSAPDSNETLVIAGVSNPVGGSVILNGDGSVTFTPAGNFNGPASFDYVVNDGTPGNDDTGHVTFSVTPVDDGPPAAADDALSAVAEDSGARIIAAATLLANDSAAPDANETLVIAGVSNPVGGTVILNGDGSVTFTPAGNFNGAASFDYVVNDGTPGNDDTGHVTFSVTPVNDGTPTAADDALSAVAEDSGARIIAAATLLANDSAAPDSDETLVIAGVSNPVGGSVILNGDGSVTFTPAGNFNGPASFDYVVNDGTPGNDDTGQVTFSVTPVDDGPPAAADDALSAVAEDSGARIIAAATLLANDSAAPDSDETLVIAGVSNPVGGTVILNGDGSVTFTPAGNFNGPASFDYVVNDGTPGNDDTGQVTFSVIAVNHPPEVSGPVTLAAIDEDSGARVITQAELLDNSSDVDGPPLAAANLQISAGLGSLVNNGNGTWSYTPAPNDDTQVTFSYQVTDGTTPVATSAKLFINPVSDAPPIETGTSGDDSFTAPAGARQFDGRGGIDTMTFGFRLVDATVTYDGNTVIVDGPSGSQTILTGFERFEFTDGTARNDDSDRLVDDLFYYSKYHDVWTAHTEADQHYHTFGWAEGRDPSAFFDTSIYMSANPEVPGSGVDPLLHFDHTGWKHGHVPSLAFDPRQYLDANPDVKAAGVDPLRHYLEFGYEEGRVPFAATHLIGPGGFDFAYYLQNNPDVAAAGVDPLQHFRQFGWHEGRDPNALFDVSGYLSNYSDVQAAGVNPLDHYNQSGWHEGRDPSPGFDTTSYLGANSDVASAGVNPLTHFLRYGLYEGRDPNADGVWG